MCAVCNEGCSLAVEMDPNDDMPPSVLLHATKMARAVSSQFHGSFEPTQQILSFRIFLGNRVT